MYDDKSDNGWSAFLMPELGKSFKAGSMSITAHISDAAAALANARLHDELKQEAVRWESTI